MSDTVIMKLLVLFLSLLIVNAYPNDHSFSKLKRTSVSCPSITAYFEGTLQDPQNRDLSLTASFQIKLEANQTDKTLYFSTQHFNQTEPALDGGFFNYFYDGGDTRCYLPNRTCSEPFVTQPTDFTTEIFSFTTQWFYLRLLYFPYFDNSFILTQAIGNCTNDALTFLETDTPDPSLYSYCVCCGDYNPDSELKCPPKTLNEIPYKSTTPKPVVTTTQEPIITATHQNPEKCTSLIAQYEGEFQDMEDPVQKFNAQFKFKLEADQVEQIIHFTLLDWNQTFAGDFELYYINFDFPTGDKQFFADQITDVKIPFVDETTYLSFEIAVKKPTDRLEDVIAFNILGFPSFDNQFKLVNTNGSQCTENQPHYNPHDWNEPDPALYSYRLCCGL